MYTRHTREHIRNIITTTSSTTTRTTCTPFVSLFYFSFPTLCLAFYLLPSRERELVPPLHRETPTKREKQTDTPIERKIYTQTQLCMYGKRAERSKGEAREIKRESKVAHRQMRGTYMASKKLIDMAGPLWSLQKTGIPIDPSILCVMHIINDNSSSSLFSPPASLSNIATRWNVSNLV